ncbi:hypothetical protein [Desulfuromonas sp. TF]|jgi:hypothetical protein|nr:hypothetical protein [Desulfuromonas sp. TF]
MRELLGKTASLLTVLMLLASLTACATPRDSETTRIKCPACGYEFEAPRE